MPFFFHDMSSWEQSFCVRAKAVANASRFISHVMWSCRAIAPTRASWVRSIVSVFVFAQSFNRWLHLLDSPEHDIGFSLTVAY